MAGFHIVHDLYAELVSLGCDLKSLYDYSVKELLFILKYKREGLAYQIWKQGLTNRMAAYATDYPANDRDLSPELFEKEKPVKMPDWLKDDYKQTLEKRLNVGRS